MEIGLPGEVTAHVDGRSLGVGPARQRRVLAALAVDVGRLVPMDRLLGRVHAETAPAVASTGSPTAGCSST